MTAGAAKGNGGCVACPAFPAYAQEGRGGTPSSMQKEGRGGLRLAVCTGRRRPDPMALKAPRTTSNLGIW